MEVQTIARENANGHGTQELMFGLRTLIPARQLPLQLPLQQLQQRPVNAQLQQLPQQTQPQPQPQQQLPTIAIVHIRTSVEKTQEIALIRRASKATEAQLLSIVLQPQQQQRQLLQQLLTVLVILKFG